MKALHLAPPYPSCFSISRPTRKTTKLPETTRLLSERQSGTTSKDITPAMLLGWSEACILTTPST
jgi:hypothetical protein